MRTKELPEMHIFVSGVNHSTTPIEIREKLAVSSSQLPYALRLLSNSVSQGLILSTCNRTEIYSVSKNSSSPHTEHMNFLEEWAKVSEPQLSPYIYLYQDESVIKHLFHVAAGLDSMIIGEFEILGQIKQSLDEAEKANLVKLPLRRLFHQALQVGRRVRDKTGISRNALSVSSMAVELAKKAIGDLNDRKVLTIGTGEAGRLVAKALKERGVSQIIIASRTQDKASSMATALGGKSVNISNLSEEMKTCDIAITCTGAPHIILDHQTIQDVMNTRSNHPLVLIDIAVPRDIAPEVKEISKVFLYDIDDLTHLSEMNRKQRGKEVSSALKIIDAEVRLFDSWWQATEVKPVISSLVKKADTIRQKQLQRTLKKLPPLSPEEQESLEAMTRAIVQKVLHSPIQYLKDNPHTKEENITFINELFSLDKE